MTSLDMLLLRYMLRDLNYFSRLLIIFFTKHLGLSHLQNPGYRPAMIIIIIISSYEWDMSNKEFEIFDLINAPCIQKLSIFSYKQIASAWNRHTLWLPLLLQCTVGYIHVHCTHCIHLVQKYLNNHIWTAATKSKVPAYPRRQSSTAGIESLLDTRTPSSGSLLTLRALAVARSTETRLTHLSCIGTTTVQPAVQSISPTQLVRTGL